MTIMGEYKGYRFHILNEEMYTIYEDKGDHYREVATVEGGVNTVKRYIDHLIKKDLSNCEY